MELVACEPTSTWQCNMRLHATQSLPQEEEEDRSLAFRKGTWQDKLRGQGNMVRGSVAGEKGSAVPCVLL